MTVVDGVVDGARFTSRAPAPAVDTATRLLDALAAHGGTATLDELTRDVGEPRSSIHRILTTLITVNAVNRAEKRGGYRLGPKLLDWGNAYMRAVDLFEEFRAVATPLAASVNETVRLATLDLPDVVWVAKVDCTRPVRLASEIGQRDPVHACAAGKVILASDTSLLDRLETLAPVTSHTVTSKDALAEELARVDKDGYASDEQEATEQYCSLAAPVHLAAGALAALSVGVCCQALETDYKEKLAADIVKAASELAARVGGGIA